MLLQQSDDGLLFPVLQPEVAGNPPVVLVSAAAALPPGIALAGRHAQPPDEPPGADLAGLGPAPDELLDNWSQETRMVLFVAFRATLKACVVIAVEGGL